MLTVSSSFLHRVPALWCCPEPVLPSLLAIPGLVLLFPSLPGSILSSACTALALHCSVVLPLPVLPVTLVLSPVLP